MAKKTAAKKSYELSADEAKIVSAYRILKEAAKVTDSVEEAKMYLYDIFDEVGVDYEDLPF